MGTKSILIVTIILVTIILLAPIICGDSIQKCEECHTSSHPSGDYIFVHPLLILSVPTRVSPDQNFTILLDIDHYGSYELKSLRARAAVTPSSYLTITDEPEKYIDTLGTSKGRDSLEWRAAAGAEEARATINLTIEYTAYYGHTDTTSTDVYTYTRTLLKTVEIKPTPLAPSTWNIVIEKGKTITEEITLIATEDLTNLNLAASPNIEKWVEITSTHPRWSNGYPTVRAGQTRKVTITFSIPEDTAIQNGYIEVSWEIDGEEDKFQIAVTLTSAPIKADEGSGWLGLLGRITGLVATGSLIFAIFSGGISKTQKKFWNRIFGTAKKRVDLHCALSYEILTLSVFHGVLLWAGPYYNTIWSDYIVLGMLSACIMGVVAVNGIYQKKLVKLFGYKVWRYIHLVGSLCALALCLIHGLTIGTDIGILPMIG